MTSSFMDQQLTNIILQETLIGATQTALLHLFFEYILPNQFDTTAAAGRKNAECLFKMLNLRINLL